MPLLSLNNLTVRFRGPPLLDGVSCRIDAGQRIGLLGRNGAGKTTLMRILSGELTPDHGEVSFAPGTRVSLLPQDVPQGLVGRVAEVIASGQPATAEEQEPAWKQTRRQEELIALMELAPDARFELLSSGMKRRVLLARALVSAPDLLLLDEPTNHLDVDAIIWLEEFLLRWNATLMFVTHDRMFLRKLANRILEIDRGRLFDWSCDYDTFLARKEAALAAEEKQNALFDKRLAEEEVWIRTGIKARRTRNEGRVRALEEMRRLRSQRRAPDSKVRMAIQEAARSGVLVAEIDRVTFRYGDRPIVREFSTTILRGDKIGIIGRNGVGKTTLLRILLGELAPQQGSVRLGTNLQVAYFDQLRQTLREEESVQENVGEGYETLSIEGRSRHIIGYLQDFLFSPERARAQVKFLSGGERNRVLLAKLFAKPANVIVLDEPTNDLDAETVELLESLLVQFRGTVLLVSHDREFLNNVVTSTIAMDENGAKEYDGGYDDWLRQRPGGVSGKENVKQQGASAAPKSANKSATHASGTASSTASGAASGAGGGKRRRTFKERQEYAEIPATIERLDGEIATLHAEMASPEFYQQPGENIAAEQARLKRLEAELSVVYQRWEELEQLAE
jgi:ATP-binding cassette subfamily F protein uup